MKVEITDRSINVQLPQKLFKKLKQSIVEREEGDKNPKLKLMQATYLVYQVIYMPFKHKDQYEDGWVPICSKAHRNIGNFSIYMAFLVDEKFLERHEKNYSTSSKTCKKYRLTEAYRTHVLKPLVAKGHPESVKGIKKKANEKMEKAKKSTPHLTKWLDPTQFEVNYNEAMAYIKNEYWHDKDLNKKNNRIIAIARLKSKEWGYSREGRDNRLHSLLTSLPKDLRRYVTYSGAPLISLDIKNSQPFIFSTIIRNIIQPRSTSTEPIDPILSSNESEGTIREDNLPSSITKIHTYLYNNLPISTMFDGFYDPNTGGDLEEFVQEVQRGVFYEKYGDLIWNECLLRNNSCGDYFLEATTKKGIRNFAYPTLRKAAKDVIMRTLFGSKNSYKDYVKVFKNYYPKVYEVMQIIKHHEPDEGNYLPILLQNIEADCILDYCTKKISLDFPEIPMFTVHDSIVTTVEYTDTVENLFKLYLEEYFGVAPILAIESWTISEFNSALVV